MAADYLEDMATQLVAAGLAGLASATTGTAPPVGYVIHSPSVGDNCCDSGQLTVHLAEVFLTDMADEGPHIPFPGNCCAGIWKATFVVTLLRCVRNLTADGKPAASSAQASDAGDLLVDLWALLTQLDDQIEGDTLWPAAEFPGIHCADITLGRAEPVPIEGNCAGWTIPITVRLNDAGPTGS